MSTRLADLLQTVKRVKKSTSWLLSQYKKGAKLRGFVFTLTDAYADELFRAPCHYCNYEPPHQFNGIDRVVNGQGYTIENVVTCCRWCNRAKGRSAVSEFVQWLEWVKKYKPGSLGAEPLEWTTLRVAGEELEVLVPSRTLRQNRLGPLSDSIWG